MGKGTKYTFCCSLPENILSITYRFHYGENTFILMNRQPFSFFANSLKEISRKINIP